jgi:signal transduction histidine kinase
MTLAELIRANLDALVDDWFHYARDRIEVTRTLSTKEIKNSSRMLFTAIADDMDIVQTDHAQFEKARGQRPGNSKGIVEHASEHADDRVAQGFTLPDLASEFRAARASVMRLLARHDAKREIRMEEIERFNEAVDEALAISIGRFDAQLDQARDMFLGVLGHDLRNPLGAILNSAQVLQLDTGLPEESARIVERIHNSGRRIQGMVDDLLDFTRAKLGGGLPVFPADGDLGEAVGHVVDELRTLHPRADIRYETRGDLRGRWDAARLAQLASNLGGNAIQHGDISRPVAVRLDGGAERVVLTVRNEGATIGAQARGRIFDPLTRGAGAGTGEPAGQGSIGLGLYICRQIALAHDGTIDVASDARGTVFTVGIPRRADRPAG